MTIVMVASLSMIAFATVVAVVRIVLGPSDSERAVATELVFFAFIGFVIILGINYGLEAILDVVLIATLFGFLSALSLARVLKDGKR